MPAHAPAPHREPPPVQDQRRPPAPPPNAAWAETAEQAAAAIPDTVRRRARSAVCATAGSSRLGQPFLPVRGAEPCCPACWNLQRTYGLGRSNHALVLSRFAIAGLEQGLFKHFGNTPGLGCSGSDGISLKSSGWEGRLPVHCRIGSSEKPNAVVQARASVHLFTPHRRSENRNEPDAAATVHCHAGSSERPRCIRCCLVLVHCRRQLRKTLTKIGDPARSISCTAAALRKMSRGLGPGFGSLPHRQLGSIPAPLLQRALPVTADRQLKTTLSSRPAFSLCPAAGRYGSRAPLPDGQLKFAWATRMMVWQRSLPA